jgi:hypothetical protein
MQKPAPAANEVSPLAGVAVVVGFILFFIGSVPFGYDPGYVLVWWFFIPLAVLFYVIQMGRLIGSLFD